MKMKRLAVMFFIISIASGVYGRAKAEDDPYPMFEIPVMSNAYNIKKFINKPKGTKSINYLVRIKYPALEVLQFYDARFRQMGFVPSFDGRFGKRKWECFIDGTKNGNPEVRQLLALWINPKLHAEAVLVLIYEKTDKKWGDELRVLCQIQPTINTERLENFLKQLNLTNQYAKFMELLDRYRMPNGEVNMKKAISENPDNEYLKQYKSIIDQMNREREILIKEVR